MNLRLSIPLQAANPFPFSPRLCSFVLLALIFWSLGANHTTRNFVVSAPDPAFARKVGEEAERYRKQLAELWLGHELPAWPQPCPIHVRIDRHAGGETSFAFVPDGRGGSIPIDWRMKIFGSPERLLDSVLPHEITHTIFATHFGRPLPRWADEGACTTVEHQVEKKKNHHMLLEFLTSNRGIPFNQMFAMKQYPRDILPLYSQGYSLARYLIEQKGHRHFVDFVGEGMRREIPGREPQTWNSVAKQFYGYDDLSDLQVRWLAWVKQGSPRLPVAQNNTLEPETPSLIAVSSNQAPNSTVASSIEPPIGGESWYVHQSRSGGNRAMQRPAQSLVNQSSDSYRPGSVAESKRTAGPDGTIWR